MARYLIVAHQTAESPELVGKIGQLAREDDEAEFALLVPATPVDHLFTWTEGESVAAAREKADTARALLEAAGARVIESSVGDGSPLRAIAEALRNRPDYYDVLVISTLPVGISRWLKLDLPTQAERRFELPVVHVTAEPERAEPSN